VIWNTLSTNADLPPGVGFMIYHTIQAILRITSRQYIGLQLQ